MVSLPLKRSISPLAGVGGVWKEGEEGGGNDVAAHGEKKDAPHRGDSQSSGGTLLSILVTFFMFLKLFSFPLPLHPKGPQSLPRAFTEMSTEIG